MYRRCKLNAVFLQCVFAAAVLVKTSPAQDGYYWRSYYGIIPHDALPGGSDESGYPIYIGLTLHPGNFLLPGTIYPKEKKIFYEYGAHAHSTDLDVFILCTTTPENFYWITGRIGMPVSNLTQDNRQLVRAGSDRKRPLVVGRAVYGELESIVGKILIVDDTLNYLWYPRNGTWRMESPYDVLIYNPQFDVRSGVLGE